MLDLPVCGCFDASIGFLAGILSGLVFGVLLGAYMAIRRLQSEYDHQNQT